jgi:hypothetical protein
MTARILRIELRRSTALWSAALIAAAGAFVLYTTAPAHRWWMGLVIVQRDVLQVIWPLALGAGAWQARRERRSRIEELLATTPRPRWRRVAPTAAARASAAAAGYLAMFAVGTGHLSLVSSYFPVGAVPVIVVGALSLVAAVWLGLGIGSRLPWALTAPLLAVAGLAAQAVPLGLVGSDPVKPGAMLLLPYLQVSWSEPGALEAMTVSARASLSQVLWFAALATTGLALFSAASRRTRAAAVLPAVIGAVITLLILPRNLSDTFVLDPASPACSSDKTCVSSMGGAAAPNLREPGGSR